MNDKLSHSHMLQQLMDNMEDHIFFKDTKSRFIMINEADARWLGFKNAQEAVGKSDFDLFSEEFAEAALEDEKRILDTGEPMIAKEERELWPDGSVTWVTTSKVPLLDEDGSIAGCIGIGRDITAQKEVEIRAAELAEENRQFREEMENDLRMAEQLQKTYFPSSYPVFTSEADNCHPVVEFCHSHYPGGMVGGDFCSIRKLSDTEAGIFICDVMGHGIRAALGTASVRAVVEISHQEKDPGQFLKHMNQVLFPILRQDDMFMFATACYMVIDVSTHTLKCANAGHPKPILLSAEHHDAQWIVRDDSDVGPALAVCEESEYTTTEYSLKSGDSVFMYTDGLYEALDTNQEEFGEDRLLKVSRQYMAHPLKQLFSELVGNVRNHAAEGEPMDDVCLVGFQIAAEIVSPENQPSA